MIEVSQICRRLTVYLIALASLGCGARAEPTPAGPTDPVPFAATSPEQSTAVGDKNDATTDAEDQSLTSAEYIALGMPAPARLWGGADMQAALAVLNRLANSEPQKLPRYQSDRSGQMFDRICSDENFDLYRNQSLPLSARMPDAIQMMQAINSVAKLYLAQQMAGNPGSEELIQVIGAQFQLTVVVQELVDAFIPTLDQKDPTYAKRMDGLSQMRKGNATMIAGAVQMLSERDLHSTAALKRLVAFLKDTCGKLLSRLPEENRAETLTRLEALLQDPLMEDLQPDISALLKVVEATEGLP